MELARTRFARRGTWYISVGYPMAQVLARMPGATMPLKAQKLGVTKQTVYGWLGERCRPNAVQAKKLAKLTGLDATGIAGWLELDARHPKQAALAEAGLSGPLLEAAVKRVRDVI